MVSALFVFLPFVIFLLIAGCQAQLTSSRSCKEIPAISNFSKNKILGRWYRYASYNEYPFGRCEQIIFGIDKDDVFTMVTKRILNTASDKIVGNGRVKFISNAGFFFTSPKDSPFYQQTFNFWKTDYTSYAIEGSCYNDNRTSIQYFWVMTRDQFPSGNVIATINKAMKDEGLQQLQYNLDNQKNCPANM